MEPPRVLAWGAALLLGGAAAPTLAAEPRVAEHRLENGLTVLLRPVSGATQAAVIVLYRVGESHDLEPDLPAPAHGVGHLLEHLYVTGAAGTTPARTATAWMRSRPAGWNAQTAWDHTVLAEVVPAAEFPAALDDAAARMGDLRIAATDLARELPRLAQELTSMGRGALGVLNAARTRLRGKDRAPGGSAAALGSLTVDDLTARWKRLYKPTNAILVLAGALGEDPLAAVRARFDAIAAGQPAPPVVPLALPSPPPPARRVEGLLDPVMAPRGAVALALPLPPITGPAGLDLGAVARQVLAARWLDRAGALGLEGRAPVPGALPFVWQVPLDSPGELVVWSPAREGESGAAAIARLEAFLAEATKEPLGAADLWRWSQTYGGLLGLFVLPDAAFRSNLYGLAYGLGRRHMLGIDPEALRGLGVAALSEAGTKAAATGSVHAAIDGVPTTPR